jgi:hypothetical protein
MLLHVVLFRPRPDLGDEHLASMASRIAQASDRIPEIRRAIVGRRHLIGAAYDALAPDMPYLALFWFDDERALRAYLEHPAHAALSEHFRHSSEAAVAYDFEIADAADAARLL